MAQVPAAPILHHGFVVDRLGRIAQIAIDVGELAPLVDLFDHIDTGRDGFGERAWLSYVVICVIVICVVVILRVVVRRVVVEVVVTWADIIVS